MPSNLLHETLSSATNAQTHSNDANSIRTDQNANAEEDGDVDMDADTNAHAELKPKTKRKKHSKPHILHAHTFRKPAWSYMRLRLTTPSISSLPSLPPSFTTTTSTAHSSTTRTRTNNTVSDLSPLLTSSLLTSALTAYLGLTGSSIPIDILKTSGRDAWIRVQRQDARALRAGLSGWVGNCETGDVPGEIEMGTGMGTGRGRERVAVGWRVVGESGVLLGVVDGDDGRGVFGD